MKTKVLYKKINDYGNRYSIFDVTQTHRCYIFPTIIVNFLDNENSIRFSWLFWEIEYTWNASHPDFGVNTQGTNE